MNKANLNVLLIDDDAEDYLIIKHYLAQGSHYQYNVTWLNDYDQGLLALLSNAYDVCFLDYRLTQDSGITLLREAIINGCDLPLIMCTGQGSDEVDQDALQAGAMDYLVKSALDTTVLERTVRYAIARKQNERELKQLNAQHQYLAEYDGLTGLANRRYFDKMLLQIVERNRRNQLHVALLFLDLDSFKQINDRYGHSAGDELLRQVATRLQKTLRRTDFIFRLGGDEFVVVIEGTLNPEKITVVANKIIATLSQDFSLGNYSVNINVSIGIAVSFDGTHDTSTLIKSADIAMYAAKKNALQRFVFFSAELDDNVLSGNKKSLLQQTLVLEQISLHYHCQMSLNTQTITAIEASAHRIDNAGSVLTTQGLFMLAENVGLISKFSYWLLRQALRQCHLLLRNHPIVLHVDIADSVWQQGDILVWLPELIAEFALRPGQLQLECHEEALMRDPAHSLWLLHELNNLGVGTAIDQVGLGRTVLRWLPLLPVRGLKLAATLLHETPPSAKPLALAKGLLALANQLGYPVTLLGVDTPTLYAFAQQHHASAIQGDYCGHDLSLDALTQQLMQK